MHDTAITIRHISKQYRIGKRERYKTLRESITSAFVAPLRNIFTAKSSETSRRNQTNNTIWALKDISLEIKKGDVVGIVGANGAGKSTLLKILARITEPTKGMVELNGRVGSLLEVGTGFHLELTGRENIYLNGAVLGMKRVEINSKFDEIVEFAGIGKFLDTPVKHYSSGMYMRLAFSVAAHLEPEILLVDEVLAVGDIEFQKKCLGKMGEIARGGRTVLFVSHNMEAVSTLTTKAMYLQAGRLVYFGKTGDVINRYIHANKKQSLVYQDNTPALKPKISKVKLITSLPNNVQKNGDKMIVEITINTPEAIKGACLSFQMVNIKDQNIAHLWTFDSNLPMCRSAGLHTVRCIIPKLRLYMGTYFLKIHLSEPPGGEVYQNLIHVCPFEVVMYGQTREFQWNPDACVYLEDATWENINA